jgi:dynein heavy chain
MQAVNWIKKKESNNKLIIRTFADADFAKQLELAVQYGVPMLIEGVDEFIDPLLDPVLEKNVNIIGSRKYIQIKRKPHTHTKTNPTKK